MIKLLKEFMSSLKDEDRMKHKLKRKKYQTMFLFVILLCFSSYVESRREGKARAHGRSKTKRGEFDRKILEPTTDLYSTSRHR